MKLLRAVLRFGADDAGVGSIYMLLLLPVFLMVAGLGMDGAAAFRTRDMLQSTADAAAIAAALKLPVIGPASVAQKNNATAAAFTYAKLNMTVAGFGNVLNVNAANNGDIVFGNWDGTTFTAPAPNGSAENAIQLTVKTATVNANAFPTSFLALVGKTSWDINASATAMVGKQVPLCVLAYGSFSMSGASNSNLKGCTIESQFDMTCDGANQANPPDFGLAGGLNGPNGSGTNYCGVAHFSNQPVPFADPYAPLAGNIPAFNCAAIAQVNWYQQSPAPAGAGNVTASTGNFCGDIQLQTDVTLNAAQGTVVIKNGHLDTNGHTLTVINGTIIFTGDNSAAYAHNIIDTSGGPNQGTITMQPPTSGSWLGVDIYQNPILTINVDIPIHANEKIPTLNVDGVVYLPHANLRISGNVNSGGAACLLIVANDITITGTGDLLAQRACLTAPNTLVPVSRLVQ